jgi:hypothetical protein
MGDSVPQVGQTGSSTRQCKSHRFLQRIAAMTLSAFANYNLPFCPLLKTPSQTLLLIVQLHAVPPILEDY